MNRAGLTALFLAGASLVAATGVSWVSSQSLTDAPAEPEHPQEVAQAQQPIEAPVLSPVQATRNDQHWTPSPSTPEQIRNYERQHEAERLRRDYELTGCFDSQNHCLCLGPEHRPIDISARDCKLVASEPQVFIP